MTINLDPAKASGTTALLDRRAAGARQDRWMLELERAGIATRAAKDSQVREKPADADPRAVSEQAPRAADARPAEPADGADRANAESQPQAMQEAEDGRAAGTPQRHALLAHVVHAAARAPAPASIAPACDAPPLSMPAGAVQAQRALAGAAAAAAPLSSIAFHAHAEAGAPEAQLVLAADSTDTPPAIDEAPQASAAPATPEQGDSASFEKRLLHLYVADDGVHAWLRDAELQGQGARALAQALAEQVAAAGKPLAGLTINGKSVAMRTPPDQDETPFALSDVQQSWTPVLNSYPSIHKGNS